MQITFLDSAGVVLFVRDDAEQANWTQEEYTVNATFPFVSGKVIRRGQRISFRDPATDKVEFFEIRNVTTLEPDHYQQIIAEHIALSELSDDHIDNKEIANKTAAQALTTVLSGTLWAVGTSSVSNTSTADIGRGNVWQAVGTIAANWNCYITPRITVNNAGNITGRYLDITPAQGTWRGVRLSISKNMSDSTVIYDDSEVLTALYGYGGTVDTAQSGADDTQKELDFGGVVWTQTADHPAKPSGQKYLEYPEKTALYGRNGRARFGYYQNSDITDANTLLQKTWESLKASCEPKISITGTVSDLYRLGYIDQPLRLHDLAIIEVEETGETFQKEIIKLDVNLIDPTATLVDIGDYIPNIIYINRDTNDYATTGGEGSSGGRGGGGGGRGAGSETNLYNTYSAIAKSTDEYGSMIGLVVGKRNGNNYIKAAEITLSINASTGETNALINANHINISATDTVHTLAGDIEHDAQGRLVIKNAGGMYVERTEGSITTKYGVFDNGNLTGGVMVEKINGQANTYITGGHINISATNTVHTLAGDIEHDAQGRLVIKNAGGMYVQRTEGGITTKYGVFDNGNLTGGVVVEKINGQTTTHIAGDKIIVGSGGEYSGKTLDGSLTDITSDFTSVNTLLAKKIDADYITANRIRSLVDGGSFSSLSCTSLMVGGVSYAPNGVLKGVSATNSDGTITIKQKFMSGAETTVITFEKGDTDAAYDQGWDDCVDATAATGATVLSGYETYASGRSVELFLANGTSAGTHIWRYGGQTATRYRLQSKRGS